jgi:hypothetical protein
VCGRECARRLFTNCAQSSKLLSFSSHLRVCNPDGSSSGSALADSVAIPLLSNDAILDSFSHEEKRQGNDTSTSSPQQQFEAEAREQTTISQHLRHFMEFAIVEDSAALGVAQSRQSGVCVRIAENIAAASTGLEVHDAITVLARRAWRTVQQIRRGVGNLFSSATTWRCTCAASAARSSSWCA